VLDDHAADRNSAGVPLLPGEKADSHDHDDADHWVAVYEELTAFLHASSAPRSMLDRYSGRLGFWRGRRDELGWPATRNGRRSRAAE